MPAYTWTSLASAMLFCASVVSQYLLTDGILEPGYVELFMLNLSAKAIRWEINQNCILYLLRANMHAIKRVWESFILDELIL